MIYIVAIASIANYRYTVLLSWNSGAKVDTPNQRSFGSSIFTWWNTRGRKMDSLLSPSRTNIVS